MRVKGMVGVMEKTFQKGQTERTQQTKEVDLFNFLFDPTSFTQVGGWVGGWVGGLCGSVAFE